MQANNQRKSHKSLINLKFVLSHANKSMSDIGDMHNFCNVSDATRVIHNYYCFMGQHIYFKKQSTFYMTCM